MIHAHHLRKVFYPARPNPIVALEDVSFDVQRREVFGLLGPNGAGKTTLLRILAGIIQPTSGSYSIDGAESESPEALRRRIGFLSGNTRLYARLTGRETLRYFGRLFGMDGPALEERIAELTALLDMGAFVDRRCETLSTGQTQRVSIARVLLHDPDILILDEPTAGLDVMSSRTILEFIGNARTRDRCILFSTHYMTEAEILCDRIGFIHLGRILALGTQAELMELAGAGNLQEAFFRMAERETGAGVS